MSTETSGPSNSIGNYKQALRNYKRAFWPVIIVYMIISLGVPVVADAFNLDGWWIRAGISLLNGLPIIVIFFLIWRMIGETDEYTRLKQLEAITLAAGIMFSFVAVWGFMEIHEAASSFPVFFLTPAFLGLYGIVYKLRGGSGCS